MISAQIQAVDLEMLERKISSRSLRAAIQRLSGGPLISFSEKQGQILANVDGEAVVKLYRCRHSELNEAGRCNNEQRFLQSEGSGSAYAVRMWLPRSKMYVVFSCEHRLWPV